MPPGQARQVSQRRRCWLRPWRAAGPPHATLLPGPRLVPPFERSRPSLPPYARRIGALVAAAGQPGDPSQPADSHVVTLKLPLGRG